VQDELPDFRMTFTFTFDRLKLSLTLPTTRIFLFVLEAGGGLKKFQPVLVDVKTCVCSIELTV
jgi:hypothetical protein